MKKLLTILFIFIGFISYAQPNINLPGTKTAIKVSGVGAGGTTDTIPLSDRVTATAVIANSKLAPNGNGVNLTGLTKSQVGLSNVDNTTDASKPVSTAQQTALNLKENSISSGTTSQYWRGDKSFQNLDKNTVGLSNLDNTSDANKPVSTLQQTALNLKANLASPSLTGVPLSPTAPLGTKTTQIASTEFVDTTVKKIIDDSTQVLGIGEGLDTTMQIVGAKTQVNLFVNYSKTDSSALSHFDLITSHLLRATSSSTVDTSIIQEVSNRIGINVSPTTDALEVKTLGGGTLRFGGSDGLTISSLNSGGSASNVNILGGLGVISGNVYASNFSDPSTNLQSFRVSSTEASIWTNNTQRLLISNAGDLTVSAGLKSTSYFATTGYQTVTSGSTSTIADNTANYIYNPASLTASLTITMPATPVDGQWIYIAFGGTIAAGSPIVTALTISPNSGYTIYQALTPTAASGGDVLMYHVEGTVIRRYK